MWRQRTKVVGIRDWKAQMDERSSSEREIRSGQLAKADNIQQVLSYGRVEGAVVRTEQVKEPRRVRTITRKSLG